MGAKPKMGEWPTISVGGPVGAELLYDSDRFSDGHLLMRIDDTHGVITDNDGKKVGSVGMAVGGNLYVEINGRCWLLSPIDLFRAVVAADDEQYPAKDKD